MKMTVTGVMGAFRIVRAFRTTFPKRTVYSRECHRADAEHGANMDEPIDSLRWHLAHLHGLSCILEVPRSQRWSCPVANSICCLRKHAIDMRVQPWNPNGKPRGKPMVSPRKSTVTHRAVHSKRNEINPKQTARTISTRNSTVTHRDRALDTITLCTSSETETDGRKTSVQGSYLEWRWTGLRRLVHRVRNV